MYYCGKKCQRAAWKEHKQECGRIKFLTDAPSTGQVDYLRLIAKVIIKMRQGK